MIKEQKQNKLLTILLSCGILENREVEKMLPKKKWKRVESLKHTALCNMQADGITITDYLAPKDAKEWCKLFKQWEDNGCEI